MTERRLGFIENNRGVSYNNRAASHTLYGQVVCQRLYRDYECFQYPSALYPRHASTFRRPRAPTSSPGHVTSAQVSDFTGPYGDRFSAKRMRPPRRGSLQQPPPALHSAYRYYPKRTLVCIEIPRGCGVLQDGECEQPTSFSLPGITVTVKVTDGLRRRVVGAAHQFLLPHCSARARDT